MHAGTTYYQILSSQTIKTFAVSPPHANTLDVVAGSTNSPDTMSPQMHIDDLDEDDICPVCESECTCRRPNAPVVSTPSSAVVGSGSVQPVVHRVDGGDAPATFRKPTLKIKLTLPPSMQSKSHATSSIPTPTNARSTKKKSKKVSQTMSDGASGGGSSLRLAARSSSLNHPSIPAPKKKRGRPPKHTLAARAAVNTQRLSHSAGQFDGDTDQDIYNVPSSRPPTRKRATVSTKASATKKLKKLADATPTRNYKKSTVPVAPVYESSELSDVDDSDSDAQSIRFPTFISACSSASGDSSDSDWTSDSNISSGAERDSSRRKRDPLGGQGDRSPPHKWERHNKWEIRPRKKSVGAEGSSEADGNGDSDDSDDTEEEKQEEEAEADADAEPEEDEEDVEGPGVRRLMRYAGVATGWTDDDDSLDDAELFFANLSDSSDDAMPVPKVGNHTENDYTGEAVLDEDEVMEEVFETDILGFDLGLGESVLNTLSLSEGVGQFKHNRSDFLGPTRNIGFELQPIPEGYALEVLDEADVIMATSEEEEAVAAFENETAQNSNTQSISDSELQDDEVDMFDVSDGGSTTEDDYVDVDGIATPRNLAASLRAVDPMRTMSAQVNRVTTRSRSGESPKAPRPADILAGRTFLSDRNTHQGVASNPTNAKGKNDGKSSSVNGKRLPPMGSFASQPADAIKKLVIAGPTNEPLPSPFPAIRRLRRRSLSSGLHSRSGSDVASGHSRPSSLLGSTRSPYQSLSLTDFSPETPDLPLADSMDLTDVLVPSILEGDSDIAKDEPSASDSNNKHDGVGESDEDMCRHIQSLQRWDRIPMDTFRRTQMAVPVGSELMDVKDNISWAVPGARRAHRPADGFSYGSAAGGMLKASPFSSSTLWEGAGAGAGSVSSSPTSERGRGRGRNGQRVNRAVVISPVLLPAGDVDRTSTEKLGLPGSSIYQPMRGEKGGGGGSTSNLKSQHSALAHALSIKSRKELRREKRGHKGSVGASSSFHLNRHHHFPNSKSRSSSSMQRSNVGSSFLPPLSI